MWPTVLMIVYCVLIAAASFAGGMVPSSLRLTHTRMQVIMSLVGGLVLGVGLLHLLPHSVAETHSLDDSVTAALFGLLAMFFLIRIFHVHQHGPVADAESPAPHDHEHDHGPDACDHLHHAYPTDGEHCAMHRNKYSWIGLAVGLTLHTLIDGVALAASVAAAARGASGFGLLGAGTFLAVLLHKPLDAMSITSVMAAGGWSRRVQIGVNLTFASMVALGAIGFYFGVEQFGEAQHWIVGIALGFAAGVFLCISLADILPELQFHAHDRFKLSVALLAGVLIAWAIGFLEPEHSHSHGFPGQHQSQDHGHDHL